MASNNSSGSGSSLGCCLLKIIAVLGVIAIVVGLGVGFMVWRAGSWIAQMPQPAPANYAPLVVSAGEQEDVERVKRRLEIVSQDKNLIDETLTPIIVNSIIDWFLKDARQKNQNVEAEAIRTGFEGEHMKVEVTWKAKDDQGKVRYINLAATFDAEVQDGKITKLELHKFAAGGREAPFLVRFFVSSVILKTFKEGVNNCDPKVNPEARNLEAFKLIKREGDRWHIIIDPTKFQEAKKAAEKDDAADPNDATKAPNPGKDF